MGSLKNPLTHGSQRALAYLLLIMTVVLVLAPVIRFPFVLHQDGLEILGNRNFHPFDAMAFRRIWGEPGFSRTFIPVNYSVLGGLAVLSRWIHGLDPLAQPTPEVFHVAGVALHTLNTCLVFSLLRPAVRDTQPLFPWTAFLAALLFALHPVQVESYVHAGNLTITLGAACSLLSLDFFLRSWRRPEHQWRWYAGATLSFCLGLLSQPTVVMLPVAAFAFAWAGRIGNARRLALSLFPWLLISAVHTWLSLTFQPPLAPQSFTIAYWLSRSMIAADSILWHLSQVLWPRTLSIDYERTADLVLASRFVWLSVVGVLGSLVLLLCCARKGNRWLTCGGLVFISLLLPVSGLVPTFDRESMSVVYDRHLYSPMLGVALVFASLLSRLAPDFRVAVGLVIICLLGFQARSYQAVWSSSVTLFQHVVAVSPRSWYGHGQLGTALLLAGRSGEAAQALARTLELNPKLIDAKINLGQAFLDLGRNSEAQGILQEAVQQAPLDVNAHNNLSVSLLRRQAFAQAESEAREALRLSPGYIPASTNLALALAGQSKTEEAVRLAEQIVAAEPGFAPSWRTLSEILLKAGRKEEGIWALTRACQLDPQRKAWMELLQSLLSDDAAISK